MILPSHYGVILADPPWSYRNGGNGAAKNHYPTMSTDQIRYLSVGSMWVREMAKPDAVLLLWATWPLLPEAMSVIEHWGFTYLTGMPWLKLAAPPVVEQGDIMEGRPTFGTGFWIRGCTELILIARRGKPRRPDTTFIGLISERFAHSRKPDNLHQYAETLEGPYLELFARRTRPNWTCWGNEIVAD